MRWVAEGRLILDLSSPTRLPVATCHYSGTHTISISREEAEANAQMMARSHDLARALADLINTISDDRPEVVRARELISGIVTEALT